MNRREFFWRAATVPAAVIAVQAVEPLPDGFVTAKALPDHIRRRLVVEYYGLPVQSVMEADNRIGHLGCRVIVSGKLMTVHVAFPEAGTDQARAVTYRWATIGEDYTAGEHWRVCRTCLELYKHPGGKVPQLAKRCQRCAEGVPRG